MQTVPGPVQWQIIQEMAVGACNDFHMGLIRAAHGRRISTSFGAQRFQPATSNPKRYGAEGASAK